MIMKMLFIGSVASGKGTYTSRLAKILGVPVISMGQTLRNARDDPEFGKIICECQDKGEFVPLDITAKLFQKRVSQPDCEKGYVVEGFPRNREQAEKSANIKFDFVVNLIVPEDIIIARVTSRRQCSKCKWIYNLLYLKPKVEGVCDKCGGELEHRKDDTKEVAHDRLKLYNNTLKPFLEYYKDKSKILDIECTDVNTPPELMVKKILKAMGRDDLIKDV